LKQRILALLWDLDGTILDSGECHFKSWQHALEINGFTLDRAVFYQYFGRNNQVSLRMHLGFEPDPSLAKAILTEKEDYFRKIAPREASLVNGVESWLAAAKRKGYLQAVASSAPMENITTILESFHLMGYFDSLISGEKLPAKPEPDVFLSAADRLNCRPETSWVIEDAPAGVQAAKAAGMRCVAVTTYRSDSDLSLADVVIRDFSIPFEGVIIGQSWNLDR